MLRFLRLLRLAFWRAFQHDAFSIAKASAYSSILTFFPALLVVGSVLATSRKGAPYLREILIAYSAGGRQYGDEFSARRLPASR
jgi:membrane protein